jgi:hypothetical protein
MLDNGYPMFDAGCLMMPETPKEFNMNKPGPDNNRGLTRGKR